MSDKNLIKLFIPFDKTKDRPVWKSENSWGAWVNDTKMYFPFSVVEDFEVSEAEKGFSCWIPAWFVKKNELEVFKDTKDEPSLFG